MDPVRPQVGEQLCASPVYLQRAGSPQRPSDLSTHACLIYAEVTEADVWRFKGPDGGIETVHVRGPLASMNAAFVHQMALAGHGVLLGPSLSFKDDFSAGRLIPLLSGWRSARALPVHVIYPHQAVGTGPRCAASSTCWPSDLHRAQSASRTGQPKWRHVFYERLDAVTRATALNSTGSDA